MDRASVPETNSPRWFHFIPGEATDETMDLVVLSEPYPAGDVRLALDAELEELLELRTASL